MVVEIAIRKCLKEPPRTVRPRPTIAELEKILDCPEPPNVQIRPDGSIEVDEPVFARDLANAALTAIYADGWMIVERPSEEAKGASE